MPSTIEDHLARTLDDAAREAPALRPGFADGVRRRRRQRRLRRTAVSAVSALAAVGLAGSLGAYAVGGHDGTLVQRKGTTEINLATVGTADRVWPKAVSTVPERLPDGRTYTVERRLPDHRLLVTPENQSRFPVIYDPVSGATTELMTDRTATFGGMTSNDRYMVWTASHGSTWTVYTAPITGGAAAVRATFNLPNGNGTTLVEPYTTATAAYFTVQDPAVRDDVKVYRLPDVGAPQAVPAGSKGMWWFEYPGGWALDNHAATPETPDKYWNIETGQHLAIPHTEDPATDSCNPILCTVVRSGVMTLHRPGGAPLLRLTGLPAPASPRMPGKYTIAIKSDRFVVIKGHVAEYLVDLREKRAALLSHPFTLGTAFVSPTTVVLAGGPAGQQILELPRI
jgi:hypothetical protein